MDLSYVLELIDYFYRVIEIIFNSLGYRGWPKKSLK